MLEGYFGVCVFGAAGGRWAVELGAAPAGSRAGRSACGGGSAPSAPPATPPHTHTGTHTGLPTCRNSFWNRARGSTFHAIVSVIAVNTQFSSPARCREQAAGSREHSIGNKGQRCVGPQPPPAHAHAAARHAPPCVRSRGVAAAAANPRRTQRGLAVGLLAGDPVDELLSDALVAQQGAGAEPAQRHLDGRGQARGEGVGRQVGVLRQQLRLAARAQQDAVAHGVGALRAACGGWGSQGEGRQG